MSDAETPQSVYDTLTLKQQLFVDHYAVCKNAYLAQKMAGYSGTYWTLAQGGWQNLQKDKIQQALRERFAEHRLSTNEALEHLRAMVESDPGLALTEDKILGVGISLERLRALGLTHMIKGVDANGKIQFYDRQRAIDMILRAQGAYEHEKHVDVTSGGHRITVGGIDLEEDI